jgi:hypothetical protein
MYDTGTSGDEFMSAASDVESVYDDAPEERVEGDRSYANTPDDLDGTLTPSKSTWNTPASGADGGGGQRTPQANGVDQFRRGNNHTSSPLARSGRARCSSAF